MTVIGILMPVQNSLFISCNYWEFEAYYRIRSNGDQCLAEETLIMRESWLMPIEQILNC